MKKLVFVLGAVVLLVGLLVPSAAMANGESTTETLGPFYSDFDYWQPGGYNGWGPALYYDQPVQVHYVATNEWTMTRKELDTELWWVRQSLTQRGTAYVWNWDKDTLLDTKPFNVNEVTTGEVGYLANWYHVYSFSYVDKWHYRWHIDGIYHYWGRAKDGVFLEFAYWVQGVGTTILYP